MFRPQICGIRWKSCKPFLKDDIRCRIGLGNRDTTFTNIFFMFKYSCNLFNFHPLKKTTTLVNLRTFNFLSSITSLRKKILIFGVVALTVHPKRSVTCDYMANLKISRTLWKPFHPTFRFTIRFIKLYFLLVSKWICFALHIIFLTLEILFYSLLVIYWTWTI